MRAYDPLKRALDVLLAGAALLLFSPVLVGVALAIALTDGRPVLFAQRRPGRHGRPFTLVKFRTMRAGPGSDADRLTRLGKSLRATSLDELPTLWNVLRGHMSLVGPRPLLMSYLDRYTPEQRRRHEVRPGITGLAQVRGRNALGWEQRFAADIEYVERRSLALDLQLLARTVRAVAGRRGIAATGHATMPEFLGAEFTGERL
jgi:lipopolysaccharide/colanic/teichoic acid biosynthesis glycosyltransferase